MVFLLLVDPVWGEWWKWVSEVSGFQNSDAALWGVRGGLELV